jgi:hypothetical protein
MTRGIGFTPIRQGEAEGMKIKRQLTLLALSVLAAGALTAGTAGAAQFTSTKKGPLTGSATSTQVFNAGGGVIVECTTAATTGTTELVSATQAVVVKYSGCGSSAPGMVKIVPAHYILHASGTIDITEPISIEVEGTFGCNITIPAGSGLSSVGYANLSPSFEEISNVAGAVYTVSNHALGLCGSSGTNGTFKGKSLISLSGGTISWDS